MRSAADVSKFFQPGSIAVIGATETRGLGSDIVRTLESQGYAGTAWYVNPNRAEVFGKRTYRSVLDLPEPPDLAMVMVERNKSLSALEECHAAGIRNVVLCSAGFSELDATGRNLEQQLRAHVAYSGVRVLGPNAIGFFNVADGVPAIAVPPPSIPDVLRPGNVAVVSQSAGLMISTMELGARLGLGFRLLASTGNSIDIDVAECVRWLATDGATDVIALVIEGMHDGRELLDAVARAQSADKVVIALFLGMSDRGRAAAITHTASIAPAPEVLAAVVESAGIVRVDTVAELVDRAALFSRQSSPTTGDLAIITISGGTKVLAADVCDKRNVRLAHLGDTTVARLASVIPSIGSASNPLDVTAAAIETPAVMSEAVRALADDQHVGQIALVMHLRRSGGSEAHQRLVTAFVESAATVEKQLVVISSIPEGLGGHWLSTATGAVPMLNDISSLAAIGDLQRLRPTIQGPASVLPELSLAVPGMSAGETLAEVDVYPLLQSAGIMVAPYATVATVEDALEQAARIGYPVALKYQSPIFPHRSRMGLLALNIASDAELAASYARISARAGTLGDASGTFLIQRQVESSPELIVGTRLDDTFGPIVVVGPGGASAESSRETVVRLAPISVDDAREALLAMPWVRRLLANGQTTSGALDSAAVAVSLVSRVASQLAGRLTGLEVNPLLLLGAEAIAVDALATVAVQPALTKEPAASSPDLSA